jgi:tetratricopeptide (TPR) repeat protein
MNEIYTYSQRLTRILYACAGLTLLLGISAIYLYQRATPQKLFSEYYHPYERRLLRGASNSSALKDAYSNGKMDSVIQEFNASKSPVQEEYLLAGIAFLDKNEPAKAIEIFKQLIQKNTDEKSDFFEEDAEYYLAMGYLGNEQPEKAMPIFEKIQADMENPYNGNVSEWFMLNVKTSIAKK